jgi:hypothetical protein
MPADAEPALRLRPVVTVIGDTVSTASRFQGLTRTLDTSLAVADGLIRAIRAATPEAAAPLVDLKDQGEYAL